MDFNKPITDTLEAQKFIVDLYFKNKLFHLDDDPKDIISYVTGEKIFNKKECKLIRQRVDEVFTYIQDPHILCLALTSPHVLCF